MPWSNDQFTGTLVIPTGATSGARIEIDGATGRIEVYNAADQLVYVIDGTIPGATAGVSGNPQVTIDTIANGGRVQFPTNRAVENFVAKILALSQNQGDPDEFISLRVQGPSVDTHDDRIEVILASQNADGSSEASLIVNLGLIATLLTLNNTDGMNLRRDFLINGVDQGRGLVDFTAFTASGAGVTTTETVFGTSGSVAFLDDRAYRIEVKCYVESSVSLDTVRTLLRKTNAAGQQLFDSFRVYEIHGNNAQSAVNYSTIIRNVSGATVTAAIALTYVRGTGTGNVFIGANATNPAWIRIEDIGPAADYPGTNAIT